jgi:hypothetical protein
VRGYPYNRSDLVAPRINIGASDPPVVVVPAVEMNIGRYRSTIPRIPHLSCFALNDLPRCTHIGAQSGAGHSTISATRFAQVMAQPGNIIKPRKIAEQK